MVNNFLPSNEELKQRETSPTKDVKKIPYKKTYQQKDIRKKSQVEFEKIRMETHGEDSYNEFKKLEKQNNIQNEGNNFSALQEKQIKK